MSQHNGMESIKIDPNSVNSVQSEFLGQNSDRIVVIS
jgi:hypothetical protein